MHQNKYIYLLALFFILPINTTYGQYDSILTYKYAQIQLTLVEKIPEITFASKQQNLQSVPPSKILRDCYNDGYASGKEVKNAAGSLLGGLFFGFLLGAPGGVIPYLIVSNGNPQPPHIEVHSIEDNCLRDYERGYREGALKVKKAGVIIGTAIASLVLIPLAVGSH